MIAGLYDCFAHWHKIGSVYVYADTHFNDKELAAVIPCRPTDEEHIKLINRKVGKHDTLLLLGDVGDLEYASKLKGYKVLIAGNHDKGLTAYKDVFNEVYSGPLIIGEKLILSHEPVNIPWAFNLHGHIHNPRHKNDSRHLNCCSDAIGYSPINFNQLMKQGPCAHIKSIHRETIDGAIKRKKGNKNK